MSKNEQLNEGQLKQVNGGDAIEDAAREAIKEQEEAQLNKQIEELENHRAQRASGDLSNAIDSLINILKKAFSSQ